MQHDTLEWFVTDLEDCLFWHTVNRPLDAFRTIFTALLFLQFLWIYWNSTTPLNTTRNNSQRESDPYTALRTHENHDYCQRLTSRLTTKTIDDLHEIHDDDNKTGDFDAFLSSLSIAGLWSLCWIDGVVVSFKLVLQRNSSNNSVWLACDVGSAMHFKRCDCWRESFLSETWSRNWANDLWNCWKEFSFGRRRWVNVAISSFVIDDRTGVSGWNGKHYLERSNWFWWFRSERLVQASKSSQGRLSTEHRAPSDGLKPIRRNIGKLPRRQRMKSD